jgi:hypothetical protein
MNATKLALGLSLSVVSAAALTACNDIPPYTEARAERYAPPQIQLVGPGKEDLRTSTVIDQPIQNRNEDDLLFVTVPVRATGDQVLHVQYRVTFFDATGMALPGGPTGWFRQTVQPGAWTPLKFNSTTHRAVQWQMELRYAR